MPSAGTITSEFSDFPSGADVGKIVDNNLYTKFVTNHNEFYIIWEGSKNAAVNYYSLTSADDAAEKDPKSWTLSGSNDKATWTTLDEQENQTFGARKEVKEYEFENSTEYKYYKLDIQSNNGNAATQIAEWRMEVIPTNIEDLMGKSGGSSFSSLTPMGNHYANRHVTTDEDRTWLMVAENEPPAPASASNLYLVEFPVNLFPYGKPLPADVNQHAIGNCGGVAALASMAYIYPDFVKSLIKDNGNKTYTVSMFDPQGKPVDVTVTSKFLTGNGTNIDAASGKNNTATWSTVLEKAVMKWNCIYKVNTDIGGIGSEHVPPLFTGDGNSFAFSPNSLNSEQLARAVKVCLRQGYLVVGGFNRGDLSVDGSKTVTAHAYTLMHSANKSALFIMRNPWGGNPDVDGTKDGVLNIPNDYTIPPTIDLRITYPGIAAQTGTGVKTPYIPPTLKSAEAKMRVADYLLRPTIRR
ncbi:MAG: C2 family cysteine protease [Dysgonomonas sp.]